MPLWQRHSSSIIHSSSVIHSSSSTAHAVAHDYSMDLSACGDSALPSTLPRVAKVIGSTAKVIGSTDKVIGSTDKVIGSTARVIGSTAACSQRAHDSPSGGAHDSARGAGAHGGALGDAHDGAHGGAATGLLASEIEIEIEILAYEQGLVLTPSLQQPESDEIGPRSSDETAYGSDEIGPRSSDETAYGRRHLPRTAPYSTPHHPLRSQWRTCPPRRILCSRSGCLNASLLFEPLPTRAPPLLPSHQHQPAALGAVSSGRLLEVSSGRLLEVSSGRLHRVSSGRGRGRRAARGCRWRRGDAGAAHERNWQRLWREQRRLRIRWPRGQLWAGTRRVRKSRPPFRE